jgi:hypothetical protein
MTGGKQNTNPVGYWTIQLDGSLTFLVSPFCLFVYKQTHIRSFAKSAFPKNDIVAIFPG